MKSPSILFINGSLHGIDGNTFPLVNKLSEFFPGQYEIKHLSLCENKPHEEICKLIDECEGIIFGTGTYWQSWSSHLQKFFEEMVDYEGHKMWMGKPVCVIVTMHSVGGMEVAGRIQSNLSMFGLVIPPMCNLVHSYVNFLARKSSDDGDIWDERYLNVIAHNLITAIEKRSDYMSWQVETEDSHVIWCKK